MAIFGLFGKQSKEDLNKGLEKTKESVVKKTVQGHYGQITGG